MTQLISCFKTISLLILEFNSKYSGRKSLITVTKKQFDANSKSDKLILFVFKFSLIIIIIILYHIRPLFNVPNKGKLRLRFVLSILNKLMCY
jgi:hypothetical protein